MAVWLVQSSAMHVVFIDFVAAEQCSRATYFCIVCLTFRHFLGDCCLFLVLFPSPDV